MGFNDVGLSVRRSETSDDAEMADVFNRAHAHIAGTVIRSAEDIAWRCRRQPGMPDEGGILVEDLAGSMLGYAFVKRNGDITEFAVDPDGPRRGAARALVAACEERGSATGAARVRLNVPIDDDVVARVLEDSGWVPLQTNGRRYVTSMDPGRLVRSLAARSDARSVPVEIVVSDPLPWQQNSTAVGDGPRIHLVADQRTFNEILLGGESPWKAVVSRRLRITPFARTVSGARYLKAVQTRASWFHTLGDVL